MHNSPQISINNSTPRRHKEPFKQRNRLFADGLHMKAYLSIHQEAFQSHKPVAAVTDHNGFPKHHSVEIHKMMSPDTHTHTGCRNLDNASKT